MNVTEKEWEAHGLACAVLLVAYGKHRCGYVKVPEGHPWHGVPYNKPAPCGPLVDNTDISVDDVGFLSAFVYALSDDTDSRDAEPGFQVAVHGGVTFSGSLAAFDDGWWFGFDCAHLDDTRDVWTLDRVTVETERMAEQIAAVGVPA